jgi:hypothetical protein
MTKRAPKLTKTPSRKMQDYRSRLRAAGLRPVQIWVPNVKARGFEARLRRQIAKLDPAHEQEVLEFISAAAARE